MPKDEIGTMKPGEIRSGSEPQILESAHTAAVLEILKEQLKVLRQLSMPAVYIPNDWEFKK